jgi:hypothetical protein
VKDQVEKKKDYNDRKPIFIHTNTLVMKKNWHREIPVPALCGGLSY